MQCKAVQEIVAARTHYGVRNAIAVSKSGYTDAAMELANTNDVWLIHRRHPGPVSAAFGVARTWGSGHLALTHGEPATNKTKSWSPPWSGDDEPGRKAHDFHCPEPIGRRGASDNEPDVVFGWLGAMPFLDEIASAGAGRVYGDVLSSCGMHFGNVIFTDVPGGSLTRSARIVRRHV